VIRDADFVIYDTAYRDVVSARTQSMNNDYKGLDGMTIEGRPDDKFMGDNKRGRSLRRESAHF
jgi:hypothetical protein